MTAEASPTSATGVSSMDARIYDHLEQGAELVLITILRTQGPGARRAGTRALFTREGLAGTLGGGLFEAHCTHAAQEHFTSRTSATYTFAVSDDVGRGKRDVLIEFLPPTLKSVFGVARDEAPNGFWFLDLSQAEYPKRSLILGETPAKLPEDWNTLCDMQRIVVDPDLCADLRQKCGGKAQILLGNQHTYVEPLPAQPILLICGQGTLVDTLIPLATQCGFCVDVVDDTDQATLAASLPTAHATFSAPDFADILQICQIREQHFVLVVTNDPANATTILRQLLVSKASYLGLVASADNRLQILAALKADDIPATELAALNAPAGLMIGAETPEQMAVALVAELLAAKTGTLKHVKSPLF